ncbi:unnamed protein product [Agarophyton chilense]
MNRYSAAASRVRRDAYTKALEAELVRMERAYGALVVALRGASVPEEARATSHVGERVVDDVAAFILRGGADE